MSTPWGRRVLSSYDFGSLWKGDLFTKQGHMRIYRFMPSYITMTGEDVTTEEITIKFPHRLCHVQIKHTDALNVDSIVAMTTAHFDRKKWDGLWFNLFDWSAEPETDEMGVMGDGYEFPQGNYRFVLNTTEGHKIWIELYIQELNLPSAGVEKEERYHV